MEALTTLVPSHRLPTQFMSLPCRRSQRRYGVVVARAGGGRDRQWGRLVDEDMIMLRLRIRAMKMMEGGVEEEDYGMMKWEKDYYVGEYGNHVCGALGFLQNYFMNVRPSLAVGTMLLVALSVFLSSGLLLSNSINMINALFSSLFGLS